MSLHSLMISLDRSIGQPGSSAYARHADYAARAGRLSIIAPAAARIESGGLTILPVGGGKLDYVPRAVSTALAYAKSAPPIDLIITQDLFLSGIVGVVLRQRLGAPLLVQNHSTIFDNPAWLAERPLINRARLQLARRVLASADFYRTVNERERTYYIQRLRGEADRAAALALGTASAAFTAPVPPGQLTALRERLGIAPTDRVVLWVGYPVRFKRLPLLLETFAQVSAQVAEARLLLVGVGADHPTLPALAQALGVQERVTFAGAVDHAALPAYYALAQVFMMTSAYEGVPRVLFEAGAAGLPLAALRAPGVDEAIQPDVTGILRDDPADLAAQVAALLRDPDRARRLGAAAREHALRDHNADDYADRWVALWRRAVELGRKS